MTDPLLSMHAGAVCSIGKEIRGRAYVTVLSRTPHATLCEHVSSEIGFSGNHLQARDFPANSARWSCQYTATIL